MEKVKELTDILKYLEKLNCEADLSEEQKAALATAQSRDIALAQQKLLAAGMGSAQLWRLWTKNRRFLPDQAARLRAELPQSHLLQKVLAEHEMFLCFVSDLKELNATIQNFTVAGSTTQEIRSLAHVADHLLCSNQHRAREEEIIFPEIISRGYYGPLEIICNQHIEIIGSNCHLDALVYKVDDLNFDHFKTELARLAGYLVPVVRMHIFLETNIIFPQALELIKNDKTWDKMNNVCEQIGYCGYDIGH